MGRINLQLGCGPSEDAEQANCIPKSGVLGSSGPKLRHLGIQSTADAGSCGKGSDP